MTDLQRLLSALASWFQSENLTPPPYVQREIDKHEPPKTVNGGFTSETKP